MKLKKKEEEEEEEENPFFVSLGTGLVRNKKKRKKTSNMNCWTLQILALALMVLAGCGTSNGFAMYGLLFDDPMTAKYSYSFIRDLDNADDPFNCTCIHDSVDHRGYLSGHLWTDVMISVLLVLMAGLLSGLTLGLLPFHPNKF